MKRGYTKSEIMTTAWKLARQGAKKFGGSAKQYIGEALKLVYKRLKSLVVIPAWFVNKKSVLTKVLSDATGVILKETEKAVYVECLGDTFWCPKSVARNYKIIRQ